MKIDDVEGRDSQIEKRNVIVLYRPGLLQEIPPVPETARLAKEEVRQPGCGMGFPVDIKMRVCNHVHHKDCLDLRLNSLRGKFSGELPAAVQPVRRRSVAHSLFSVKENEPTREHVPSLGEHAAYFEEESRTGSSVVSTDETG